MKKEFTKRHLVGSSVGEKEFFAHEQMAPLMREPVTPRLLSHTAANDTRLFVTEDVSVTQSGLGDQREHEGCPPLT